ncbi:GDYXXLXY domain-containing protein [Bosea sp. 2KB_26]|uniref:GDYXXLXY domain-containing protein n=1 Tax=Bosea sp. 2KB_26 TaxID=3237475 RepID=UPI003F8E78F9
MDAFATDRVVARVPAIVRAVVSMVVLCGAIGMLVEGRARILRSGSEVRLRTAPVDPRDLFRGDYVILNYDISTLDLAGLQGDRDFSRGDPIHVQLTAGTDGFARPVGAYKIRPLASGTDVVIEGHVLTAGVCPRAENGTVDCSRTRNGVRVAYGLESYFVPQGTGLAIERTERSRLEVVAAVAPSGSSAIKRLLIDGKLVHAEPPF